MVNLQINKGSVARNDLKHFLWQKKKYVFICAEFCYTLCLQYQNPEYFFKNGHCYIIRICHSLSFLLTSEQFQEIVFIIQRYRQFVLHHFFLLLIICSDLKSQSTCFYLTFCDHVCLCSILVTNAVFQQASKVELFKYLFPKSFKVFFLTDPLHLYIYILFSANSTKP